MQIDNEFTVGVPVDRAWEVLTAGTATFVEKDDAAHRAVISASGRDSRGAGNASAQVVAQLRPDGDRTVVTVDTDLRISGKIAQLGRGLIKEVSTKLLGQFVECLEGKLGGAAAAAPVPPAAEPEPLDIMGVAGGSIARRIVPLVLTLIVLVGVTMYLVTR